MGLRIEDRATRAESTFGIVHPRSSHPVEINKKLRSRASPLNEGVVQEYSIRKRLYHALPSLRTGNPLKEGQKGLVILPPVRALRPSAWMLSGSVL